MKKKILTLTLTVVLLFALTFSLTSCGSAQTFTIANLSIELNSSYFDIASMVPVGEEVETFAAYMSLFEGLIVIPTFAPNTYDLSFSEYIDNYSSYMDGGISYYGDIPVVSYEQEADGNVFTVEAYIYEDEGGFWVVAFMNIYGDITEKSETILGYVDSIVIE